MIECNFVKDQTDNYIRDGKGTPLVKRSAQMWLEVRDNVVSNLAVDSIVVPANLYFDTLNLNYFTYANDFISKVIFNNPATIVFWKDGTKTVVKCSSKDEFDPYFGLCCAITKKMIGNNSRIKKILKEATYCKENKNERNK